jgi:hypothetical protein
MNGQATKETEAPQYVRQPLGEARSLSRNDLEYKGPPNLSDYLSAGMSLTQAPPEIIMEFVSLAGNAAFLDLMSKERPATCDFHYYGLNMETENTIETIEPMLFEFNVD